MSNMTSTMYYGCAEVHGAHAHLHTHMHGHMHMHTYRYSTYEYIHMLCCAALLQPWSK